LLATRGGKEREKRIGGIWDTQTPAPLKRHLEEMVEHGSRERYKRNNEESKPGRLTQNSRSRTYLHFRN
jgi:hypothetical protein